MRTIALLLAIAVTVTPAAARTMYKWVDKDGKTHYTDSPPPDDAKKLAPPKGASGRAAPAPSAPSGGGKEASSARANGKPEGAQGTFKPEEEAALAMVCAISLKQNLGCRLDLNRACTMDELVNGRKGTRGLARDPRNDASYSYRMDTRGDEVHVSAVPKAPGLTGFLSAKDMHYNPGGAASTGDRKVVGGISCLAAM